MPQHDKSVPERFLGKFALVDERLARWRLLEEGEEEGEIYSPTDDAPQRQKAASCESAPSFHLNVKVFSALVAQIRVMSRRSFPLLLM